METFSALLSLYVGSSPVTCEFPSQRQVTQSSNVSYDLRLNKPLSKQPRRRWFDTLFCSLWRHCNLTFGGRISSVLECGTCQSLSGFPLTLRWRHNDHAGVSNHQPHGCLLNRLFRRKSKKTSKLRVTGLCAGNSPGTGEFPAQMASYAENVSIWWRHHGNGVDSSNSCGWLLP